MGEVTYVNKQPWGLIGSITASKSALGVTGRKASDVAAFASGSYALWEVPLRINTAEIEFSTTADADSQVVNVYAARGNSDYVFVGTLTLTGGTQTGPNSNVYVDTIVEGGVVWKSSGTEVINSAGNHIARWMINLVGYSRVLFIATTLVASSTLQIYGSGL